MNESIEKFYQELKDQEAARLEDAEHVEYITEEFDFMFDDRI